MPIFNRFESGNSFKVSATKATGKPIEDRQPPKPTNHPMAHQRASKAPVTLPTFKLSETTK